MQNVQCIDIKYIIVFVIILAIIVVLFCYKVGSVMNREYLTMLKDKSSSCPPCVCSIEDKREIHNPIDVPIDPIRQYDYAKTYDPLEQPARRIGRYDIPPEYMKRMIDLPTRGYPDNFTQYGTLVKESDHDNNEQNKVLRLFGRQTYPGSNTYEYYTMINSGLDQIKVPIETRKRELYDDDPVHVRELNEKYRVNLHQFDQPKYYPDVLW
jgi:hypothetical protein